MSLALYRRYRPDSFEEVIGQDHVTQPLQRALHNRRVNHAYLFSGPRGCGKTTSARILARCLNCEQGPTPTPCGVCGSCTDLARGGAGSIDVIEIDAASHGGVDDARDLRERAFFAPIGARYKIYILDEAHMVSPAGFNALLKVVEEPPPHLKFIFATTEPEKVIGTIRSRTHHYPFRLVPPGVLREYLAQVCEREQIPVDPDVLPLVVRAGAGSVRDSMSVLDQLLAGADEHGVTYRMAVGLLGYTDASLLDEAVSAFAAHDGAAAFQVVDRVVEGGHDPRRFLADLLERLRDLVILGAIPDAAQKGLISAPGDRLARMREQAASFGAAELSRSADLVSVGLTEMRGATAPRLLLELVCARILLPGADDSVRGVTARLDRLERGARSAFAAPADNTNGPVVPDPGMLPPNSRPAGLTEATPAGRTPGAESGGADRGAPAPEHSLATPPWRRPAVAQSSQAIGEQALPPTGAQPPTASATTGLVDAGAIRQAWPQVLEAVARRSKVAWAMMSQNVHVVGVEGRLLQLGFNNPNLRDSFPGSVREDVLRDALQEITGGDWKIDTLVDPSAGLTGPTASHAPAMAAPPPAPPAAQPTNVSVKSAAATVPAPSPPKQPAVAMDEDVPAIDDEALVDAGPTARELLVRELGATVLDEGTDPR